MKFTCLKTKLYDNISNVMKTVAVRASHKALECILVTAEQDHITLLSNDTEMCTKTSPISANIESQGKVALPASLFFEIIRKMPEGDITVDCDSNFITVISCQKARFKIVGQDPDDFPSLPKYETETSIALKSNILKGMIRKTIFSLSQESDKPIFKGELLEVSLGGFNMVAVDGFRIAFAHTQIENEGEAAVIVPGKALNELSKILPDDDGMVKIYFSQMHIVFEMDTFIFISRLLSGDFINYKQSFPGDYQTKAVIKKEEFLSCLERTLLISHDAKRHPVYLKFEDDSLSITSQTENGSLEDEINTQSEGQPIDIAFNPKFLYEVLKAVEEDMVTLFMNTSLSPCIIRNEDNLDNKYLVLPLRMKY